MTSADGLRFAGRVAFAMSRPEEIASAVLWLCSDLGGSAVGHALAVDGGRTVGR